MLNGAPRTQGRWASDTSIEPPQIRADVTNQYNESKIKN